jgi:hypothetical protein
MSNTKQNILLLGVVGIIVLLCILIFVVSPAPSDAPAGAVNNNIDTWASGTTNTTTTINTTSTTVLASTTKWARITNPTTSTISCYLDAPSVTAASSTVQANSGLVIGSHQATSTASIPSVVEFGECGPGSYNCIRFKGRINCLASSAGTIVGILSK